MPLHRRLPKRGFKNPFKKVSVVLNVRDLNRFKSGSKVSPEFLIEQGVAKNMRDGLRILGSGELTRKLSVKAHHFSESAKKKIEEAGGQIEVLT